MSGDGFKLMAFCRLLLRILYANRKQRIVFSKMDIGEDQYVPEEAGKDQNAVTAILKAMDTYSKEKVTQPSMNDFREHW